ncbi:hypothetical protein HYALB_00013470 [Hymenoscyphus albidus]|uniref:Uncharacterized protein n=1 Tax=Hymenoscyphus albidus TaxID=595503 RepID=A0A9N9LT67_9HELO|nr:hypothetical protein HYALB_00013470 [Hymenoscyphus albidus]
MEAKDGLSNAATSKKPKAKKSLKSGVAKKPPAKKASVQKASIQKTKPEKAQRRQIFGACFDSNPILVMRYYLPKEFAVVNFPVMP